MDVGTRFYHASVHTDRGLGVSMYCKSYDVKYRKVKKDIDIHEKHRDSMNYEL